MPTLDFMLCLRSSLTTILETLKDNCSTFEDYETLVSQPGYFKNNPDVLYNKRLSIFEFAHANLIWEKNEQDIFRSVPDVLTCILVTHRHQT